jgi:hypothetical protein
LIATEWTELTAIYIQAICPKTAYVEEFYLEFQDRLGAGRWLGWLAQKKPAMVRRSGGGVNRAAEPWLVALQGKTAERACYGLLPVFDIPGGEVDFRPNAATSR